MTAQQGMGAGIAIGAGIGVALMASMGPAGLAIGMGVGVAIGAGLGQQQTDDSNDHGPDEGTPEPDEPTWPGSSD